MNLWPVLLIIPPFLIATATAEETRIKPVPVVHLDAGEASEVMARADKEKRPRGIDIRTLDEFKEGHLAGAIHIDFFKEDFAVRIQKLDRKKPYLIHCQSGGRSSRSLALWAKLGFRKIYHLDGGLLAWKKAGLPVVR